MKEVWKPGTMIYPLPAALIGCGSSPEDYNVFTVSWLGTICTDPAMCYISVRPSRHSYEIIKKNMEFTINLTTEKIAEATDWCGVRSGKDYNKFEETGLTPLKGNMVAAPIIEQSPLSIECRVKEIVKLGTHDMFIADVLCVDAEKDLINPETDAFELQKAGMLAYSHGTYFKLGEPVGKFGWSVKKK